MLNNNQKKIVQKTDIYGVINKNVRNEKQDHRRKIENL